MNLDFNYSSVCNFGNIVLLIFVIKISGVFIRDGEKMEVEGVVKVKFYYDEVFW